jgi:mRNA-degrading endonuclease HigB of HigAB toxin-antitoxin module
MEQGGDIVKNIVELRESMKLFDQRLSQLKDTIRMVDQNNLDKYKEIKSVLQDLSAGVSSDKSKILEIEDTLSRIEKQMERFARVQDVKVIEKYLSFVDPSRFLSKEDVIKIVDDYMSNKKWG